jgi:hypothetical protein
MKVSNVQREGQSQRMYSTVSSSSSSTSSNSTGGSSSRPTSSRSLFINAFSITQTNRRMTGDK